VNMAVGQVGVKGALAAPDACDGPHGNGRWIVVLE